MWLAIHDGAITLGVSLHKKMTEAGKQTAEPVVILTACLFSFVAGEHEMQPSGTCYHPNRPFWRYVSTLQMTEYPSQPRIHLINSSNRNCNEIR